MLARGAFLAGLILAQTALPASAQGPSPAASEPTPAQRAESAPAHSAPAVMTTGALPPAPLGFDQEIAERLAAGGNLANPEREDRAALARFYEARLQLLVWTGATGFTPAAEAAIAELRRAGEWGLDPAAFQVPSLPTTGAALPRAQRADAEIALGLAILKYARHARGGRAEPATLSRYLDRALSYRDPYQVIDEAAKAEKPDAYLRSLHPQHPQFGALRQKYVALLRGESVTPADQPAPEDKKGAAKRAASAADPSNLRQRLLVNMEAWRWMPDDLGDVHVWINIPEFTLRVVKAGQVVLTERVVVGKPDTQTPVFSNAMEQVIFHPSWGVPESIKREDVLPSLVRGSTRLFTHYKLRIQRGGRDIDPASVDWSTADIRQYHVYQPPGDTNVLGVVKFRFPNKHDVYMHDTPTKNLFNASVRAYSHGCVRVREPQRLAEVLLAEDQSWPASRVASAMGVGGPQNNQINLTTKFPVHMAYFTAVVEDDGKLKLFPDIYGHEGKIALGIEGKAHLIPRSKENGPIRAEAIGHLADTTAAGGGSTMRSKKEWINRAFENN